MSIHDCLLSTRLEYLLFKTEVIKSDDECPICLSSLSEKGSYGCCGTYAKQLKKCGHAMHVSCLIDENQNRHICPICRAKLFNPKKLENGIKIRKLLSALPFRLQSMVEKNGLRRSLMKNPENKLRGVLDDKFISMFDSELEQLQELDRNLEWELI